MKASFFLFLLLCCGAATSNARKFYVTFDNAGFPDAKNVLAMSRQDMLDKRKLVVSPDIGTVISYDISYLPKKGEYVGPLKNESSELTPREMEWVKQCNSGDQFYFEDIKVKMKDGSLKDGKAFLVRIR